MRSDSELREAARHASYEARAVLQTAAHLAANHGFDRMVDTAEFPWVAVRVMEAFLLHTRNMLDFLWPTNPHADDILSTDFLPGWTPGDSTIGGLPRPVLGAQLNKHLSHLTYTRTAEPTPSWALQIAYDIRRELGRFFSELPEERRAWFDAELLCATGVANSPAGRTSWFDVLLS